MNITGHFKTITKHRWEVCKLCFRVGLYWQGLTHDLSKYSPTEFIQGCKYYTGTHSPNDGERRDKGYSSAWMHHKGRNKHHNEYWTDYPVNWADPDRSAYQCVKIPVKYVAEMFCDRVAACKIYGGKNYDRANAFNYFDRTRKYLMMHPDTAELLMSMLIKLRDEGEDAAIKYVRECIEKGDGY